MNPLSDVLRDSPRDRLHDRLHYPAFDWLRGALAITVVLHHGNVLPWVDAGDFAVQVFFALSGWLIGGLLLRTPSDQLPRFYFNRAVRIWVPYYVAFTLLVGVSLLREPVSAKWVEFVTYKALMVYNLFGPPQLASFVQAMPLKGTGNHFWSVNAEEQFYLLTPLLLVLAGRFWRAPLLWAGIALAALFAHFYTSIILGVFAAVLVERHGKLHATLVGRLALAALGLATACFLTSAFRVAAPLCAICIVLLLAVPGRLSALGERVGGMSYSLYLNQWVGGFAANLLLGPFGLKGSLWIQAFALVLGIAIATAHYTWIDRPLMRHRAAWFTRGRGVALATVAYAMVLLGIAMGTVVWGAGVR